MKTDPLSAKARGSKWVVFKRKMRKALMWSVLLLVLIAGIFIYWNYFYTYSTGYRTGLLQKFSHKGNIIKTYEGEMILSNVISNSNIALPSEKFYFSVTNTPLAKQFDTIQGQMVIVHYNQKNSTLFWHGNSQYLVDSVKIIR